MTTLLEYLDLFWNFAVHVTTIVQYTYRIGNAEHPSWGCWSTHSPPFVNISDVLGSYMLLKLHQEKTKQSREINCDKQRKFHRMTFQDFHYIHKAIISLTSKDNKVLT